MKKSIYIGFRIKWKEILQFVADLFLVLPVEQMDTDYISKITGAELVCDGSGAILLSASYEIGSSLPQKSLRIAIVKPQKRIDN